MGLPLGLLSSTLAMAEPGAALRSYKGGDGQRVELALLTPLKDNRALLRILNAASPIDGLVLDAKVVAQGTRFEVRLRGADWILLQADNGKGTVYPPDVKEFQVKFDESPTEPVDEKKMLELQSAQRARGELAMAAKKPFPFLVKKYETKAAAALSELQRRCKSTASFAFEWATFSDSDMESVDAFAVCQPLFAVLGSRCSLAATVKKLSCAMGASMGLEREAEQIRFVTTSTGAAGGQSFLNGKLK